MILNNNLNSIYIPHPLNDYLCLCTLLEVLHSNKIKLKLNRTKQLELVEPNFKLGSAKELWFLVIKAVGENTEDGACSVLAFY